MAPVHVRARSGFEVRPNQQFTLSFHTDASRLRLEGFHAGSTFRELEAIRYVLLSHSKKFQFNKFKIFPDSQKAC